MWTTGVLCGIEVLELEVDELLWCLIKMSHLLQFSGFDFDTLLEGKEKGLSFDTRCGIQIPKLVVYHVLEYAISERISIEDWTIKKLKSEIQNYNKWLILLEQVTYVPQTKLSL